MKIHFQNHRGFCRLDWLLTGLILTPVFSFVVIGFIVWGIIDWCRNYFVLTVIFVLALVALYWAFHFVFTRLGRLFARIAKFNRRDEEFDSKLNP